MEKNRGRDSQTKNPSYCQNRFESSMFLLVTNLLVYRSGWQYGQHLRIVMTLLDNLLRNYLHHSFTLSSLQKHAFHFINIKRGHVKKRDRTLNETIPLTGRRYKTERNIATNLPEQRRIHLQFTDYNYRDCSGNNIRLLICRELLLHRHSHMATTVCLSNAE